MKYFILTCILGISQSLSAQLDIKGSIVDAQTNTPLEGASIKTVNQEEITRSDVKGRFAITSYRDSLYISLTGYLTQKIPVHKPEILIRLQPQINSLNEVVVSASREKQSRKEVPAAIEKINSVTIQETKATAIYQLANKVSGVYMVNLGNEQHTMAIRQPISYNALYLYLEDGLPIRPTGIFNHNALYEINMNDVKEMEVLKGPASSLYGSNAIGGSINFISTTPSTGFSERVSIQGDGYNYYRADANTGFSKGKLSFHAGGYLASQRKSWQDYTDFNKYSGSFKTMYAYSKTTHLTVTATLNYLNTETPGNLDSTRFYNRSYTSNQRFTYRKVNAFRTNARIDHSWNAKNASFLSIFFRDNTTAQLPNYYIKDIRNDNKQYVKSAGQENEQSFTSYGLLLQHRTDFNFFNSRLITGAYLDFSPSAYHANYLEITKDQSNNYYTNYINTDSLLDDYKINLLNTAAFIQYQIHPIKSLRVVAGLRFDNLIYNFNNRLPEGKTNYKQQEKNSFQIIAPKLGATYDFGNNRGVYANFSIGVQPPETSFLYNSIQQNKLREARFYNYETGGWLSFFNRKLALELSLYTMQGRNEIISVLMPDNTTQNQNAGATQHSGVEFNLNINPSPQWHIRVGGTTAKHTYLDFTEVVSGQTINRKGNRMANAPAWIGNCELGWKPGFIPGFRSSLEWQYLSKYYTNTSNTKTYSGYSIFNLRLGYELRKSFAKGTGIWLNALNLTDKLYASNVSSNLFGTTYNAAPPRTLSLGISYSISK